MGVTAVEGNWKSTDYPNTFAVEVFKPIEDDSPVGPRQTSPLQVLDVLPPPIRKCTPFLCKTGHDTFFSLLSLIFPSTHSFPSRVGVYPSLQEDAITSILLATAPVLSLASGHLIYLHQRSPLLYLLIINPHYMASAVNPATESILAAVTTTSVLMLHNELAAFGVTDRSQYAKHDDTLSLCSCDAVFTWISAYFPGKSESISFDCPLDVHVFSGSLFTIHFYELFHLLLQHQLPLTFE